jgi:hypothetical protein
MTSDGQNSVAAIVRLAHILRIKQLMYLLIQYYAILIQLFRAAV